MASNQYRSSRASHAHARTASWRAITDISLASAVIVAAVIGVFALVDLALTRAPVSLARSPAPHVAQAQ